MTSLLPQGLLFFERGWLSSNSILLDDGNSAVLIDSGYVTHSKLLLSLLRSHLPSRSLTHLVNTHLHSDHCGGNSAVQSQFPSVQTFIPYGLFDSVRHWDTDLLSYEDTGQLCPKFIADTPLRPGEVYVWSGFEWQVHAAPGHDHDALLFFNPEHRILISADALWGNGFGIVFPEVFGGNGFSEVAATLKVIEELSPRIVLPGHGPIIHDVPECLVRAHSKLNYFVQSPHIHALHAAKVLFKFKLLELQSVTLSDFNAWINSTPLILRIHHSFFATTPIQEWCSETLEDLINKKVAIIHDGVIYNQ
jgi:glyoxylase-like metal-dependent hydrolase (beta-lactamase superfamily II)